MAKTTTRRWTWRAGLAGVGALTALLGVGWSQEAEVVEAAPRWDAEAAAAFAQAGIPVPRTVMTVETDAPLDLAWVRRAFGFAEPISDRERAAITSGGAVESRGAEAPEDGEGDFGPDAFGAGGDAMPAPPTPDSAPEPTAQPRPARAELRERAAEAEAPSGAPAESGRGMGSNAQGGLAFDDADGATTEAHDTGAAEGGEDSVPQPLLSDAQSSPRVGKVLYQNASGGYDALEPRELRVVTFVEGCRARTVVDMVFSNPLDRRLQGTFYYALPDGASPAGFGMFPGSARVDDPKVYAECALLPPLPDVIDPAVLTSVAPQTHTSTLVSDWQPMQEARVVEQRRAREVYEQIVRSNIDPALLEWSGSNTFQARVFPIHPKGLKRMVLAYEQTLPRDGDLLRYVFPYPGEEKLGAVESVVHVRGAEIVGGREASDLALRNPQGEPEAIEGWARHRFTAPAGFSGALDLALRPDTVEVVRGEAAGLPGEAVYARLRPEVPDAESTQATGRAVFLVDTSLSEDGLRRSLSGQLLLQVLERDPTIQEYAVMLFDVRARWLHQVGFRPNTEEARAETALELQKIYLEGATNFSAALDELQRQGDWIDGDAPATRFLLSDGMVTWGQGQPDQLLVDYPQAADGRWLCYRFGDVPVNRELFDTLTRASNGQTVSVLTGEQLAAASRAHRKAPVVLREVRLADGEAVDLVVAGQPRLVYPGQELEVGFRLTAAGEAPAVEVVLEIDGAEQVQRTELSAGLSECRFAGRAWAELWTRQLVSLDDERLDRMVVAISQAFTLANKSASLLILETDQEWDRYDLRAEQVDLGDLMTLRASEEDQRRDRLQGIAMDDVSREGRDVVRLLEGVNLEASLPALPLLHRPLAGGDARIEAELAYRAARTGDAMNVSIYDAIARHRALSGDTYGAIRALSCLVEQRPSDAESNRLVGYACLSLGQYKAASELLARVRFQRPFEPQSYLEEALALEAAGRWAEAARDYEILLAKSFPRHNEVKTVGRYHYARLLGQMLREGELSDADRASVQARRQAVLQQQNDGGERTAIQLTIHWNTDMTDIDLWVVEPEGERCSYQQRTTSAGGHLFWDNTSGYGPEFYRRREGGSGTFDVLIHFYGNHSPRITTPTSVLLVRDRDVFGPEDSYTRRFQMRILPAQSSVLRLRKETY